MEDHLFSLGRKETNLQVRDPRVIDLELDAKIKSEFGTGNEGGGHGEPTIDDGTRRTADHLGGHLEDIDIDAEGSGRTCGRTGQQAHFHRCGPEESGDQILLDGSSGDGTGGCVGNSIDEKSC